jgi:hypothetical protein
MLTRTLNARRRGLAVLGGLLLVAIGLTAAPPAGAAVSPASERPAVFRNGTWFLRPALSSGPSVSFGFGLAGDLPVAGDWDGDGRDTPGVVRGANWFIRNANSSGPSTTFRFGLAGDLPVAGDWDQDRDDTPGVFRNGTWFYRNGLGPSVVHSFGFGLAGDLPAVWSRSRCSPAYSGVCVPPPPPDLDCGDISARNFRVRPPDPHRFDGDRDGIGCET